MSFREGDTVDKVRGYKFPGVVVAPFRTLGGEDRYVVEMVDVYQGRPTGLLHIFAPEQLQRVAIRGMQPPALDDM